MARILAGQGTTVSHCASALVVTLLSAVDVRAQTVSHEPDAVEVAASLRNQGHVGGALAVLTQARGPRPPRTMDAIADSLVAIAVDSVRDDPRGTATVSEAVATLLKAGLGRSGVWGIEHGVPYAGAASRLMRIAETAHHLAVRATALSLLVRLPHRTRLLPFLRQLATSQNPVAEQAVILLGNETGREGQEIGRELYRQAAVTEPSARVMLAQLAQAYRWR